VEKQAGTVGQQFPEHDEERLGRSEQRRSFCEQRVPTTRRVSDLLNQTLSESWLVNQLNLKILCQKDVA
jgi:hypothetical protein